MKKDKLYSTDERRKKHDLNVCKVNAERLLMIDGYIDNIKLERIIFDIGATNSILSERAAKKYSIEIIPSDF